MICSPLETLCPSGWTQFDMSCIQFGSEKKNYVDAKMDCEAKKAHLFIIKKRPERQRWISKILNERERIAGDQGSDLVAAFETCDIWVGLTYNQQQERWDWVNGERVWLHIFLEEKRDDYCPSFSAQQITDDENFFLYGHRLRCTNEHYYFCQSESK